jgi:hypothetical protein
MQKPEARLPQVTGLSAQLFSCGLIVERMTMN